MAWGDNGVCEPNVARARGYPCCRVGLTTDGDVHHSLSHFPMGYLPRWEDGELYVMETSDSGPLEGEREEQHWFLVAGHVERRQPGPHHGSWDVYLRRVDGVGVPPRARAAATRLSLAPRVTAPPVKTPVRDTDAVTTAPRQSVRSVSL